MTHRKPQAHRPSSALDGLRARMLTGDALRDLPDADREWVMRSLLKRIRADAVMALAGISPAQYDRALVQVKRWYQQRCQAYKALPKVVRPVKAPPKRRTLWSFLRPA